MAKHKYIHMCHMELIRKSKYQQLELAIKIHLEFLLTLLNTKFYGNQLLRVLCIPSTLYFIVESPDEDQPLSSYLPKIKCIYLFVYPSIHPSIHLSIYISIKMRQLGITDLIVEFFFKAISQTDCSVLP